MDFRWFQGQRISFRNLANEIKQDVGQDVRHRKCLKGCTTPFVCLLLKTASNQSPPVQPGVDPCEVRNSTVGPSLVVCGVYPVLLRVPVNLQSEQSQASSA